MAYLNAPLKFKLRKVFRYSRLYGVRRTWIKAKGQYHAVNRYETLPSQRRSSNGKRHVAIIGCGNFAYTTIAYYLRRNYGSVLRATMDLAIDRAASLFERYGADYYTNDAEEVMCDPAIDLIFVASNHASHAEYAIRALQHGKHVHVEKPHVVSNDQLRNLCQAMAASPGKLQLGFNRPLSPFGKEIQRTLGEQPGPSMFNWFIAGHQIEPDHWYFSPEEGGRVLGNLCHWTDFLLQMLPSSQRFPIQIVPVRWTHSDSDIAVTYLFGDGSIGVVTFSAKGHLFEGVKERFAAHRGNALITCDDFNTLTIEVLNRHRRVKLRHRDHGHEASIRRSYLMSSIAGEQTVGASISYVRETGQLFLETRRALETNTVLTLPSIDPVGWQGPHQSRLSDPQAARGTFPG